jgi:hypothetical protein
MTRVPEPAMAEVFDDSALIMGVHRPGCRDRGLR